MPKQYDLKRSVCNTLFSSIKGTTHPFVNKATADKHCTIATLNAGEYITSDTHFLAVCFCLERHSVIMLETPVPDFSLPASTAPANCNYTIYHIAGGFALQWMPAGQKPP